MEKHKKDELLNGMGVQHWCKEALKEKKNSAFKVPIYTHADKCDKHTL